MTHALFCPLCNAQMVAPGRCPVVQFRRGERDYHLALVLCCMNCASVSEVDQGSGDLHEFPGHRIMDLIVPDNWSTIKHTVESLGISILRRMES